MSKSKTTHNVSAAERDRDSEVAVRNGMGPGHKREGVVLRPLQEFRDSRGNRVIAKHKRDDFRETRTPRVVGDQPDRRAGEDAALEWVTDQRLTHVLDHLRAHLGVEPAMTDVPAVISAMLEDVGREGAGEVDLTDKDTRRACSTRAAQLFKRSLQARLVQA